jgi:uncharacterized cupredoxin-like copper-binding protein
MRLSSGTEGTKNIAARAFQRFGDTTTATATITTRSISYVCMYTETDTCSVRAGERKERKEKKRKEKKTDMYVHTKAD